MTVTESVRGALAVQPGIQCWGKLPALRVPSQPPARGAAFLEVTISGGEVRYLTELAGNHPNDRHF